MCQESPPNLCEDFILQTFLNLEQNDSLFDHKFATADVLCPNNDGPIYDVDRNVSSHKNNPTSAEVTGADDSTVYSDGVDTCTCRTNAADSIFHTPGERSVLNDTACNFDENANSISTFTQIDVTDSNAADEHSMTFPELQDYRVKHRKQLIFGHLNINSIKNKFQEVREILCHNYIDIFGLCETKIDDSFTNSVFKVSDYSCHRLDRNINGGGIMLYVRTSLPHRRRNDCCVMSETEVLVVEITLRQEKMFFILVYKPPRVSDQSFIDSLSVVLDKCLSECKSIFIMGDASINF